MAVEKYNYTMWLNEQFDKKGRKIEHSCIDRFSDFFYYDKYDGEDTYGTVLGFDKYRILVSQDGVKLIDIKGKNLTTEVVEKATETIILIKNDLDRFKFLAKTALFWSDHPFTPDYIAPLWYSYQDLIPIRVEDVEAYIKQKRSVE